VRIKVDLPEYPEGTEVSITGLGAFANGSTAEVSSQDVAAFEAYSGKPLREALANARGVSIVSTPKKKEGDE
jgi:hypothetical protein